MKFGDLKQAVEILIAALESLGNQASLPLQKIDTIRKHLLEADEHCDAQARNIIALQRDVKGLQRDNYQARQDRDRQQQSRQDGGAQRWRSTTCSGKQHTSYQL